MGWYRFSTLINERSPLPLFVLQEPIINGKVIRQRGVVLIGHKIVDDVFERYGNNFKKYWFIVSTCQSSTYGQSVHADLHLFADKDLNKDYLSSPAKKIPFMNMSGGLFVDPEMFFPENERKFYDVMYIAKWFKTKRIKLFVDAINLLSDVNGALLTFGVVTEKNQDESYNYSVEIKNYIKKTNAKIKLIAAPEGEHKNPDGSFVPGGFTKEEMRGFINQAKSTVLLADINEAFNRSICESLCCDVPVIVTKDTLGGIPHLIDSTMGEQAEPDPKDIAQMIKKVIDNQNLYSPRESFLKNYGNNNSNQKLKRKIEEISKKQENPIKIEEDSKYYGDPWTKHIYSILDKYNYSE